MYDRPSYLREIEELALRHGKMAFITGPRQVGKTTLAQQIAKQYPHSAYYSWDDPDFRRLWTRSPKELIPVQIENKTLVVFDELHKAPRWKQTLKGIYDLRKEYANILVTGSARLDVLRRGGESLLGRYFLFHLHPFSLGELSGESPLQPDQLAASLEKPLTEKKDFWDALFQFGGFPEPLLNKEEKFHRAWQIGRVERLVREDLLYLTQTHELSLIEAMVALVPMRVGSPFSVQSLAEDLEVSHPTARRWLVWLMQLFYLYAVPPYNRKISRPLKKQPKIYLWDWSEIKDSAARFENLVAGHLLKACHFWTETGLGRFELYYVRDKEKRETDFLITWDRSPWFLAEAKWGNTDVSSHLSHFARRLEPKIAIQIVAKEGVQQRISTKNGSDIFVISASRFLPLLP